MWGVLHTDLYCMISSTCELEIVRWLAKCHTAKHIHTHTHTHIYIYIYLNVYSVGIHSTENLLCLKSLKKLESIRLKDNTYNYSNPGKRFARSVLVLVTFHRCTNVP